MIEVDAVEVGFADGEGFVQGLVHSLPNITV